jgi:hypothetical protein
MHRYAWLFLSTGLVFSLVGCGDSENGDGGSGGSAGTGGSGGSGAMVEVSGVVTAASLDAPDSPFEGATVSVVGTSNTATSDAQGNFSVMAPTGTVTFSTTAAGHWGEQLAQHVPSTGRDDIELQVLPDALVDTIADEFGTTADPSKGLVAVGFDEDSVVGGETASISANSELSFVFDAEEAPLEGDTLVAGGGSEVIFVNADVTAQLTTTATSADDLPCPPELPDATFSVEAKVLTQIEVICPVQ